MTTTQVEASPQVALRAYPLIAPAVLSRTEAGYLNDNWLVIDIATSARYLLRRYVSVRDEDRVAFRISFQEHLLSCGFPTAPVLRTNEGQRFVSLGGAFWALFDFVDGREYDFASRAQAFEAGRGLAQFEAIAAGYSGPVVEPPVVDVGTWPGPVANHIRHSSMLTDEHEERLRALYTGPEYADDLAFFSEWRRAAAHAWPAERLSALPEAWLHCDYHGRNMLFQGDALAGLFDFDFVVRGTRAYDVGRGVFSFGRESRGLTNLRMEFCRAFLEGFESEQQLTDEERRSLAYMAVLNWVPETPFDAARHGEHEDAGARFRWCVKAIRVIRAEMNRLAPAFGWDAI